MTPSATEFIILKALWQHERLSAREIHEQVEEELGWSFSSTRKTLDRMATKGLITLGTAHGVKVFEAGVSKLSTIAAMASDFASSVLEIDGPLPVTAFASSRLLSEAELEELQTLLDEESGS